MAREQQEALEAQIEQLQLQIGIGTGTGYYLDKFTSAFSMRLVVSIKDFQIIQRSLCLCHNKKRYPVCGAIHKLGENLFTLHVVEQQKVSSKKGRILLRGHMLHLPASSRIILQSITKEAKPALIHQKHMRIM